MRVKSTCVSKIHIFCINLKKSKFTLVTKCPFKKLEPENVIFSQVRGYCRFFSFFLNNFFSILSEWVNLYFNFEISAKEMIFVTHRDLFHDNNISTLVGPSGRFQGHHVTWIFNLKNQLVMLIPPSTYKVPMISNRKFWKFWIIKKCRFGGARCTY
jgi:hypothetical protein